MNRRVVLKNVAAIATGLTVLPTWARGWSKETVLPLEPYFTARLDDLMAAVVETIIPQTDTPGAKALHVHTFVQKMIKDCYEEEVQQSMVKGLDKIEEMARQSFNQSFVQCTTPQQSDILSRMEKSTETQLADFYKLVKELTIHGYLTSEYVMVNHTNYQMVPGHYYGCVPVKDK